MRRILLLFISVMLIISGCNLQINTPLKPTQGEYPAETDIEPESGKLHVAYMETDLASIQIVESFISDDIKLIPVILSEENFDDFLLGHEYFADVILIPGSTQINPAISVVNQRVGNMNSIIPSILSGTDYYPVLDAGSIDGSQYYLPLRFQLPYALTTQTQLENVSMPLDSRYTMKKWMQALAGYVSKTEDDYALILTQPETDIGSSLYHALRLSGAWNTYPQTKETPIDEKILSEYAQYIIALWEQTQKAKQQIAGSQFCNPYPLTVSEQIAIIQSQGCIPDLFEIYNATCQENAEIPVFLNIPHYDNSKRITADVTLYAAIGHSVTDMQAVQTFLRHAFTTPEGQGIQQGLSVCRTAVQSYLDSMEQRTERIYGDGPAHVRVTGLSASVRRICEDMLNNIYEGSIKNAYWERIFSEAMNDFHIGCSDFEMCLNNLKERLYGQSDETGLSVFEIVLSDELRKEIDREASYVFYGSRYPLRELSWCIFDGTKYVSGEKSYYGDFKGSIVYRSTTENLSGSTIDYKIGSVVIPSRTTIYVYRYGIIYDLSEAYFEKLITEDDAAIIQERLEAFENARRNAR